MNNVKKFREEKGMTVTSLAEIVGITPRYLWFIEAGKKIPSLKVAKNIAHILEMNIEDIFE